MFLIVLLKRETFSSTEKFTNALFLHNIKSVELPLQGIFSTNISNILAKI